MKIENQEIIKSDFFCYLHSIINKDIEVGDVINKIKVG